MSVVLINPNLVVQRDDLFTTGIVYMPLGLAYLAAALRRMGLEVKVIDAYAQNPTAAEIVGKRMFLGLKPDEVISFIPNDVEAVFLYAINIAYHSAALNIVTQIRKAYPSLPIIIVENTQAVTAYSLQLVMGEFFDAGADYVITGESELRAQRLMHYLLEAKQPRALTPLDELDGIGSPHWYFPPKGMIEDLDSLAFPAWDLFPLENYWKLGYAHSPLSAKRYLPLLSSRGCPYPCRFCVIPATNQRRWRGRSAVNVVDELEVMCTTYKVQEFHWEDVDATVSEERMRSICEEILIRKLPIRWKLGSGIKIETLRKPDTLDLMAEAGCRYISISPESGSERMLKAMQKPFDLQHAVRMVKRMHEVGIASQACFILGYPGEEEEDRSKTWGLVRQLTQQGVDEIALFVIAPLPGAAIYEKMTGYHSLSELTFSPTWREDYKQINQFRLRLYGAFLLWKLWYHPMRLLLQPFRFLRHEFMTKMEMVPYRALVIKMIEIKTLLKEKLAKQQLSG